MARRYAKTQDCKFLKMSPLLNIGITDRLAVMPQGRVWWVEFKRPGERPTAKQAQGILELQALGHDVSVIDNIESFRKGLDLRLRGK